MLRVLCAALIAALLFVSCDAYKKPSPMEISRIIMEESTVSGVKISEVKIVQDLFEKRDMILKVRLKIGVTAQQNIIAHFKKGRKDFMPDFVFMKKGDRRIINADAVLAYGSDKKWHLKEYY